MRYRTLSEIFPAWYSDLPSEEDLRRQCRSRCEYAQRPEDMTDWIVREACPYRQEALAVVLHYLLTEQGDDEEYRVSSYVREQVETDIKRIIRRAFSDQVAEEMLHAEGVCDTPSTPVVVAPIVQTQRLNRLEQQVDYLYREVESLRHQRSESTRYCRYLIPNEVWSMDEMEKQLVEHIHSSATILAAYLHRCEKQGYMRFDNESAPAIYQYLHERYTLPYKVGTFQKAW